MRRRHAGMLTTIVLVGAFGVTGLAPAHEKHRAFNEKRHAQDDSVPLRSPSAERRLSDRTVARSKAAKRRLKRKAKAAQASSTDPGVVGRWGPVQDWPVVGIQVALLPNGKVLAFDAVGDRSYDTYDDHTFTRASVYDPATGGQTPAWVSGHDIFCAGFAHLTDGTIFTAGGNADRDSNGIVQTYTFNHFSNTWTRGEDMEFPRWYPSVTPLTNGEMLITGGRPWLPEVRGTDGSIRTLSEAWMDVPYYPWTHVAPDGLVFYAGPDDVLRKLNPSGTGVWQTYGPRDGVFREYGSHAIYDVGKMVAAGGGGGSTSSATKIDFNGSTPQVSATSSMANRRRQFNLTVLADGKVLATGGNSTGAFQVDVNGGVYDAELWNPATGSWTTLAAESVTRQYHSSALLLPDGRVLSSGGGICGACDAQGYLGKNAQTFTPPYLFKKDGSGELAARPEVTDVPSAVPYGADFQITTPTPASISKVGLVRLGANTHSINFEQRYIPLSFSAGTGGLTATVPQNPNVTPPGMYMLFVVDDKGVPSVAKMMRVAADAPTPPPPPPPPPPPSNQAPTVTLTQPANAATFTAPATVNLAADAADADGTVTRVEFYNGTTKLGEDTTAPYTYTWSGVAAGSYTLTARAIDDDGATTTSGASTITVNQAPTPTPTNQPPTASITSPANGATFPFKPTITITASATDADGTVTRVEFLDGSTVIGQDTAAPWAYTWKNVPQGTHTLRVRATDNAGAVTTSAPVGITVRRR